MYTTLYHTTFCAPQISRDDPWFPISAFQTESICGLQLLVLQYSITAHYTGLTFPPFTLLLKSCSRIRAKKWLLVLHPAVTCCWACRAQSCPVLCEELGWVRRADTAVFSSEHLEKKERQHNWELLYRQAEQILKA